MDVVRRTVIVSAQTAAGDVAPDEAAGTGGKGGDGRPLLRTRPRDALSRRTCTAGGGVPAHKAAAEADGVTRRLWNLSSRRTRGRAGRQRGNDAVWGSIVATRHGIPRPGGQNCGQGGLNGTKVCGSGRFPSTSWPRPRPRRSRSRTSAGPRALTDF